MSVLYLNDIKGDNYKVINAAMPLNYRGTASGYGSKLACPYFVVDNYTKRKYRVYAICYSNCASLYVTITGIKYFLHDYDFPER